MERLQAARHSTLVICVPLSQKPMQSASDLPPPPGVLGADSLGLPLPEAVPGASARSGADPPPVENWLGNGSDMGDSGATVDPSPVALGVVVAATPDGGVSPPADGVGEVGDNAVDGAAGVAGPVEVREVVVDGVESLALGVPTDARELLVEERACANAASGRSSMTATAARTDSLGVSIANHHGVAGSTPIPVTIDRRFYGVHKLAS